MIWMEKSYIDRLSDKKKTAEYSAVFHKSENKSNIVSQISVSVIISFPSFLQALFPRFLFVIACPNSSLR